MKAIDTKAINYDRSFFERKTAGSLNAAAVVLPLLFEFVRPRSVCDVGCGVGTWLHACKSLGVDQLIGFDGDYVDSHALLIEPSCFRVTDLQRNRFSLPEKVDLVLNLEVAEHLARSQADRFIEDLTSLSDNILFSAAIPFQGGEGHVNEQFPSYWIRKFHGRGLHCFDLIRPLIWATEEVPVHYRQNILFFSRGTQFPGRIDRPEQADRVHPTMWCGRHGWRGVLRAAVKSMPSRVQDTVSFAQRRLKSLHIAAHGRPTEPSTPPA